MPDPSAQGVADSLTLYAPRTRAQTGQEIFEQMSAVPNPREPAFRAPGSPSGIPGAIGPEDSPWFNALAVFDVLMGLAGSPGGAARGGSRAQGMRRSRAPQSRAMYEQHMPWEVEATIPQALDILGMDRALNAEPRWQAATRRGARAKGQEVYEGIQRDAPGAEAIKRAREEEQAARVSAAGDTDLISRLTRGPQALPKGGGLFELSPQRARQAEIEQRMTPAQEIFKHYDAGARIKKEANERLGEATWFRSARNLMDLFPSSQHWNQFLRFWAATSPQTAPYTTNVDQALKAYRIWLRAASPEEAALNIQAAFKGMKGHSDNLVRAVFDPGVEMSGPKVGPHNRAIPSERFPWGDPDAVVFDRHELSLFDPMSKGVANPEDFPIYIGRLKDLAAQKGAENREFMETTWRSYIRMLYGRAYESAKAADVGVRDRLRVHGVQYVSDWAKQLGIPVAAAFYLIDKLEGEAPPDDADTPR